MSLYDRVAGALDHAAGSVDESIGRQFDDEEGGGFVDETPAPAEFAYVSPLGGVLFADDIEDRDDDETTVADWLAIGNRTADDVDGARDVVEGGTDDLVGGLQGDAGGGALGTIGRALRWAGQNPVLVAGGLVALYALPALTSALGVVEGVVGE